MTGSRKAFFFLWLPIAAIVLFLGGFVSPWLANRRQRSVPPDVVCGMNAVNIAGRLQLEGVDAGGKLPLSGQDSDGNPLWVRSLLPDVPSERLSWLKCPLDRSKRISSYDLDPDVAGRDLNTIPPDERKDTVVLREMCFPGSHGHIVYLDGHVETRSCE